MGKTKRVKLTKKKNNPTGLPSINEIDLEEQCQDNRPRPIPVILDQLESINVEEKMCALQSLSFLCQNQQQIQEIVNSDLVRIAATLLMNENKSVRNATCAALRNLSLNGIPVCEHLVERDVLTPLLTLLQEYALCPDWIPTINKDMNNELDEKSDTFLHAINLLWNLCESTSIAVENFNQTMIVESFIRCLDASQFGYDIAISVGQCLLVLSEDNPNVWIILQKYESSLCQHLLNVIEEENQYSSTMLKTLIVAILSNVPLLGKSNLSIIFQTLSQTMSKDYRQFLNRLTSSLSDDQNHDANNGHHSNGNNAIEVCDDDQNHNTQMDVGENELSANLRRRRQDLPTPLQIEIQNVGWLLQAQRTASEAITNLCIVDDDDDDDDDDNNIDENGDSDESNGEPNNVGESDGESVQEVDAHLNLQNNTKIPGEILELIKSVNLIELLWQRSQPLPVNVMGILKESEKKLADKVQSSRVLCLICLQNLCDAMSTADLGGPSAIYQVWLELAQLVFQENNVNVDDGDQYDLIEAETALMRSALNHLRPNAELFQQMSDNDLKMILNGVEKCTGSEIRANWLRMLGILGCLLNEDLLKIIIKFMLDVCQTENDTWTMAEALDSFMDIFSDNDWDEIAFELQLEKRTKELDRIFKNKIRKNKKLLKGRYETVRTIQLNLSRFTQYISKQQRIYIKNKK